MKSKDKILTLVNSYAAATCGGNQAEQETILKQITEFLTTPENIKTALEQLDGYLTDRSQKQMKTGLISGVEGNMLFKLSQIKDFLGVKDE